MIASRLPLVRRNNIKQRIITALIALPIVLVITLGVPIGWFATVVTVVAAVALWELYAMVMPAQRVYAKYGAIVVGALLVPLIAFDLPLFLPVVAISLLIFASYYLFYYGDLNSVVAELGCVVLGWLYLPLLLSNMVLLHAMPHGQRWVLLVLIMTMLCDSSAYFIGTAWGKHRLYPAISPKKSVEGAIGGLGGALLAALAAHLWLVPNTSWVDCIIIGTLAGVCGQIGDLFESMLKRSANIKDSGTIFPGHGGMLDRIDSLLFSFPAIYAYLYFCGV
ncbi:MAG: phosphatidate cytidylyltransferase [Desulfuromonas sp.]|nr:phosphatidate cytidylyltransferase [Desulfuromonas sp.]